MKTVLKNGLRYYVVEDKRFPSVTSIIRTVLGEPEELKYWKSVTLDWERITRERAVMGGAIHHRILSRYTIRSLEPPCIALEWREPEKTLEEIAFRCELAETLWDDLGLEFADESYLVEHTLVSHKHGFAGTPDLIGTINEVPLVLLELKTGERVWREYYLQMGGYYLLAKENRIDVQMGMIAHIHPFGDLKAELVRIELEELKWFVAEFLGLMREFKRRYIEEQK